ncbi:hypothetical protein PENTCL1PPCAC_2882 [Pristionchus entomophagus]|uniref:F-box domain-containing protein n=1 Tax=Pristionchus entomophagus TaxID=358040 RepID=A0AAV5SDE3_9BILA|nr:hypothetical protein PENTCL1PPCAC_2882 [Pristionchus entomophagus]
MTESGVSLECDANQKCEWCESERNHSRGEYVIPPCMISRLPKEIKWRILNLLTEFIKEVRLVSKSWKGMTDEWRIPENFPVISEIKIFEEITSSINVEIHIDKEMAPCFVELGAFAVKLSERSTGSFVKMWSVSTDARSGSAYDRLSEKNDVLVQSSGIGEKWNPFIFWL